MFRWFKLSNLVILSATALAVSGCIGPSYLDTKNGDPKDSASNPFGEVSYHVYDSYTNEPPNCVAILPFTHSVKNGTSSTKITLDNVEVVRKALYAHLAPQGKKDVELPRIDFVLENIPKSQRQNYALIGKKLDCDALIIGNVSAFGSQYIGVYSKVSVGAQMRMIRASTGEPLWEGNHLAETHGGSFPLSPIGLATGILDAAMNVDEEQTFRVVDDLARRLVHTIPDNRIAILDDPMAPLKMANRANQTSRQSIEDFLRGLTYKPQGEQKDAIIKAITDEMFHGHDLKRIYNALIETAPNDAFANGLYANHLVKNGDYFNAAKYVNTSLALNANDDAMHFLKGRIQIQLNNLSGADASILKAITLKPTSTKYLNGLGFLNSLRGHNDRALAAYQMAVDLEPSNGYALYNMGVTFYNTEDLQAASDYISKAAHAYLQTGDYGQAVKALADLKELKALGVQTNNEISKIEHLLLAVQGTG